jgi:[ribosomal protein S18]-alanine N-acetyltransferase
MLMMNDENMSQFVIKVITIEDLPQVLELDKICFGSLWSEQSYLSEINNDCSDLLGLELNHSLIGLGCGWSILDEVHIILLGINPEYRRQGLGELLLKNLLNNAQNRGVVRATLEVRSSNLAAIALYEKTGFKIAGKRKGYYQDNNEDAVIMWSKLVN